MKLKWREPVRSESKDTTTWVSDEGFSIVRYDWNKLPVYSLFVPGVKGVVAEFSTLAAAKKMAGTK